MLQYMWPGDMQVVAVACSQAGQANPAHALAQIRSLLHVTLPPVTPGAAIGGTDAAAAALRGAGGTATSSGAVAEPAGAPSQFSSTATIPYDTEELLVTALAGSTLEEVGGTAGASGTGGTDSTVGGSSMAASLAELVGCVEGQLMEWEGLVRSQQQPSRVLRWAAEGSSPAR